MDYWSVEVQCFYWSPANSSGGTEMVWDLLSPTKWSHVLRARKVSLKWEHLSFATFCCTSACHMCHLLRTWHGKDVLWGGVDILIEHEIAFTHTEIKHWSCVNIRIITNMTLAINMRLFSMEIKKLYECLSCSIL